MADNVTYPISDGTVVATDDVSGVHYEKVKIYDGTADSTNAWAVDSDGAAKTLPKRSATATKTNVSAATTNTALIASNTARLGASVFNDSTSAMYVNLGSSASTTAFVVKLAAASYYEVPFGYTGAVNGIWDTATGAARVCEFTA